MKKNVIFFSFIILSFLLLVSNGLSLSGYGLVSYYSFDTDFSDYNNNNLAPYGSPYITNVDCVLNGCVRFNSVNSDYLVNTAFVGLNSSNSGFSVCSWFNLDSYDTINYAVFRLTDTNNVNTFFRVYDYVNGDGLDLTYRDYNAISPSYPFVAPSSPLSLGYHFVCVVFNGSNGSQYAYVDGVLSNSISSSSAVMSYFNKIEIGAGGGYYYIDGYVDELSIWNRPLNSSEVSEIYNNNINGISLIELINPIPVFTFYLVDCESGSGFVAPADDNTYGCIENSTIKVCNTSIDSVLTWYGVNPALNYTITLNSSPYYYSLRTPYSFPSSNIGSGLVCFHGVRINTSAFDIYNDSISDYVVTSNNSVSSCYVNDYSCLYASPQQSLLLTAIGSNYYNNVSEVINLGWGNESYSISFNGLYEGVINVSTINNYTKLLLTNYSINVININNSLINDYNVVSDYYFLVPIMKGYYYNVSVNKLGYAVIGSYYNDIVIPEFSINNVTFELWSNNSVLISLYYLNGSSYNGSYSATLIGSDNYYINGSGSTIFKDNIKDGYYNININTESGSSTYTLLMIDNSHQEINAYLPDNTTYEVTIIVNDNLNNPISDVVVNEEQLVGSEWRLISSRLTDVTGKALFFFKPGEAYRFTVSKAYYQPTSFILNPVLFSQYTVTLKPASTGYNNENSLFIYYVPNELVVNISNNLSIVISSSTGSLTSYNYSLLLPDGRSYNGSGSNAYGETFNINNLFLNPSDYNSPSSATLRVYYRTVSTSGVKDYNIVISGARGSYSLVETNKQDFGFSIFEKILIAVITIIIVSSFGFIVGGLYAGSLLFSIGLLLFYVIGFINVYFVVLFFMILLILFFTRII